MKKSKWLYVLAGSLCGIANGLFGGGGGMIIVPFMTAFLAFEEHKAHATALFVILPVTVFSVVVYILSGNIPLKETLLSGVGVIVGGIIGARLLPVIPQRVLTFIFCGVMLLAGLKMVV